jgi:hypothetical protein
LITAAVDNDGVEACHYLTPAAQVAVAARARPAARCSTALNAAGLKLGGKRFTTESSLDHALAYSTRYSHGRAKVRISHRGASRDLILVRASSAQRLELSAPTTPWRIAAGATTVVP